jgi:hypothetical protein
MTVGGVRTNQSKAMNWLRLQADGAQSVTPFSERQASSSNDHLHELIPAEEVWPNARIDFKEAMLDFSPGEDSRCVCKDNPFRPSAIIYHTRTSQEDGSHPSSTLQS